jgi:hypothetical protein
MTQLDRRGPLTAAAASIAAAGMAACSSAQGPVVSESAGTGTGSAAVGRLIGAGLEGLASRMAGKLALPGAGAYNQAKLVENPGFDTSQPLAVLSATSSHDVSVAVRFAAEAGVHKPGGQGKRVLLEILKARDPAPSQSELQALHGLADATVSNLKAALEQQASLNRGLARWDAFVLASDLEGLLLDTIGQKRLAEMLGPAGENEVDQAASDRYASGATGKEELAAWLGSKGWNSTGKKSGKVKPHLPSALLREHPARRKTVPQAVKPLDDWLRAIMKDHERSPL